MKNPYSHFHPRSAPVLGRSNVRNPRRHQSAQPTGHFALLRLHVMWTTQQGLRCGDSLSPRGTSGERIPRRISRFEPLNLAGSSRFSEDGIKLSERPEDAERPPDGSRGLQPTVFDKAGVRRGATLEGCKTLRLAFSRRSATRLFVASDRGLKPTATVTASLREDLADANRDLQSQRDCVLQPRVACRNPFGILNSIDLFVVHPIVSSVTPNHTYPLWQFT